MAMVQEQNAWIITALADLQRAQHEMLQRQDQLAQRLFEPAQPGEPFGVAMTADALPNIATPVPGDKAKVSFVPSAVTSLSKPSLGQASTRVSARSATPRSSTSESMSRSCDSKMTAQSSRPSFVEKTFKQIKSHATPGGSRLRSSENKSSSRDPVIQKVVIDFTMGLVILGNGVTMGISTDIPWQGWRWVDMFCTLLFMFEAFCTIYLFGARDWLRGRDRYWHFFETLLILSATTEFALSFSGSAGPMNMSILRLARLIRITRLLRVFRFQAARDLIMMINGAVGGMRTLFWSCVIVALPLYAVALTLKEFLGQHAETDEIAAGSFATVGTSFFTMFRCVVAGDCSTREGKPIFLLVTENHGWGFGVIYCVTMMFMTFGLFNVIVAIYVENTVAAAKYDDVARQKSRLENDKLMAKKMADLVRLIWAAYNKLPDLPGRSRRQVTTIDEALQIEITPEFFSDLLDSEPSFKQILFDLDIAEEEQVDLFETLDVDGGGTLDMQELVNGMAKLRGKARRSDIIAVKLVVRDMQVTLQKLLRQLGRSHDLRSRDFVTT